MVNWVVGTNLIHSSLVDQVPQILFGTINLFVIFMTESEVQKVKFNYKVRSDKTGHCTNKSGPCGRIIVTDVTVG